MGSSVDRLPSSTVRHSSISEHHIGWHNRNTVRMRRAEDHVSNGANASWTDVGVLPKGALLGPTTSSSSSSSSSQVAALDASSGPLCSKKRKQQSNRLRQMLKSDLRMLESPRPGGNGGDLMKRRLNLDVHGEDIQQLLKSLQSTEFVGTIDPTYHSRYLSTPSF